MAESSNSIQIKSENILFKRVQTNSHVSNL